MDIAPQILVFCLGQRRFAFPVKPIEKILSLDEITLVPHCPTHLIGVINFHSHILPVFDLAALLGLHVTDQPTFLIVFSKHEDCIGYAVNSILGVFDTKEASILVGEDAAPYEVPHTKAVLKLAPKDPPTVLLQV